MKGHPPEGCRTVAEEFCRPEDDHHRKLISLEALGPVRIQERLGIRRTRGRHEDGINDERLKGAAG
jgi:hypothetical protein